MVKTVESGGKWKSLNGMKKSGMMFIKNIFMCASISIIFFESTLETNSEENFFLENCLENCYENCLEIPYTRKIWKS